MVVEGVLLKHTESVEVLHLHNASNSYEYTSTTINGLYTAIIYQKLMISNILPTFTSLITFQCCRPVDQNVSPSWPSPSWFVAQMTVHRGVYQICDIDYRLLRRAMRTLH